ncbi:hypothetical protein ACOCG7_23900 [Paraburkholderia sp. DD10]|uniref:hypothetical protein n=1 Tax=Paraburkholderia TaxID=1822464 RepID=UPI003B9ED455
MLSKNYLLTVIACTLSVLSAPALADGECPIPFTVHGAAIDTPWASITYTEWRRMLPKRWRNFNRHFFTHVSERAPNRGIETPRQLAASIRAQVGDVATPRDEDESRRTIVLQEVNSRGKHFAVVYSYNNGAKKAPCVLVTATYVDPQVLSGESGTANEQY